MVTTWWILAACRRPIPDPAPLDVDAGPGDESDADTDADSDSDTDADTDTDTDTGETIDCAAIPSGLRPTVGLGALFPSEDFVFDGDGHLISSNGAALYRQEYPPGTVEPFAPVGSDPSSMRMLPSGDLVVANIDTSTIYRVSLADGATTPIASGFGYLTGIDVHPDGHLLVGDLDRVKRVEPDTGVVELLIDGDYPGNEALGGFNGVSFSVGFTRLYLGTRNELWTVAVDAEGRPDGPMERRWTSPIPGELFGLGVDACDNVYGLYTGRLLRWNGGAGEAELLLDGGGTTTNLQWGSGIGGWAADRIYVVNRSGAPPFHEVEVGVPSKPTW